MSPNQPNESENGDHSGNTSTETEKTNKREDQSTGKKSSTINDKLKEAARKGLIDEVRKILRQANASQSLSTANVEDRLNIDTITEILFDVIDEGKAEIASIIAKSKRVRLDKQYGSLNRTVLHEAISMNLDDVSRELLQLPNSVHCVNLEDEYGRTALHEAASRGSLDIIKDLLARRADIDATDNQNLTPLHLVVSRIDSVARGEGVVEMLLEKGAEVNTRDIFDDSPLHDASYSANESLMKLLLKYGADPDSRNYQGATPEAVLPEDSRGKLARYLLGEQWDVKSYLHKMPLEPPQCSAEEKKVCDEFFVTIRFYWRPGGISWSQTTSVYKLVYEESTLEGFEKEFLEILNENRDSKIKEIVREDIWKWIHFPANNISWVKDLILSLSDNSINSCADGVDTWRFLERSIKDRRGDSMRNCTRIPHVDVLSRDNHHGNTFQPSSMQNQNSAGGSLSSNQKPVLSDTRSKKFDELTKEAWKTTNSLPRGNKVSLVIPFIDFDSELYLNRNKSAREKSWRFSRMSRLEKIYTPYTGLSGLQAPQSLDESYYDTLSFEELDKRDRDQLVYKRKLQDAPKTLFQYQTDDWSLWESTDELSDSDTRPTKTISRDTPVGTEDSVKQTRGDKAEAIPKKNKDGKESIGADQSKKLLMVHQLWLWKLDDSTVITSLPERWHTGVEDTLLDTIRQGGIDHFYEPEELIKHIIFECSTFLEEFKYAGLGDHILDIYESAIANLANEEVSCFEDFIKTVGRKDAPSSIQKEISWIHDIKDIRDELHLIRRIFESQDTVIGKFSKLFWPGSSSRDETCRKQFVNDCGVKILIQQVKRLGGDSKRTLEALDYLVQIKQAQSSLEETEATREMNEKAHEESKRSQKLNNFIMLFTVVTVIFTPLSFMTSLYAINVEQWPHQNGTLTYSEGWITGRMFAGELTVLAVILIFVFFLWVPKNGQWLKKLFLPAQPGDPETAG